MAYDKNVDVAVFAESIDLDLTKITVAVYSYNNGTPKLQISRENRNTNTGEWIFSKLGRMTKQEVEAVLPLIQKAMAKL